MIKRKTTKLNEFDHLILFAIARNRNNRATIHEIKDVLQYYLKKSSIKFKRSANPVPTYTYFYMRINKLVDWGFIERKGKRAYSINREIYDDITGYIKGYIKLNYGENDDTKQKG